MRTLSALMALALVSTANPLRADLVDELARIIHASRSDQLHMIQRDFSIPDERMGALVAEINNGGDLYRALLEVQTHGQLFSGHIETGLADLDPLVYFFHISQPLLDRLNQDLSGKAFPEKLAIQRIGSGFYPKFMALIKKETDSPLYRERGDSLLLRIMVERVLRDDFDLDKEFFYGFAAKVHSDYKSIEDTIEPETAAAYREFLEFVDRYYERAITVGRFFFGLQKIMTPLQSIERTESHFENRKAHADCHTSLLDVLKAILSGYQGPPESRS